MRRLIALLLLSVGVVSLPILQAHADAGAMTAYDLTAAKPSQLRWIIRPDAVLHPSASDPATQLQLAQASRTRGYDGTRQRRCQTLRTCRYTRGGAFRGCISTYTCRTCRFVPTRCRTGERRGTCQELRCSWGS